MTMLFIRRSMGTVVKTVHTAQHKQELYRDVLKLFMKIFGTLPAKYVRRVFLEKVI